MNNSISGKNIVLGVTGSISCYKSADLASKLTQQGAVVDVVLTKGAVNFVSPLTFTSLVGRDVYVDMFDHNSTKSISHVSLAHKADIIIVYPATAHTIAKIAHGFADDILTTIILASRARVVVAPAMDGFMFENSATQENIEKLKTRGMFIFGPNEGRLASGLIGSGRLVEVSQMIDSLENVLGIDGDLRGQSIVVSAGGTQEPIDPVRVITNRSSGKMGFAIARAARNRGAKVTLVTAPTSLPSMSGVDIRNVGTAYEMKEQILDACKHADVLVMAAAISDYRPKNVSDQKIKKNLTDKNKELSIALIQNEDFTQDIPGNVLKVGFAAESQNLIDNARNKLVQKGLALIVANDITSTESGFNVDDNKVSILDEFGGVEDVPLMNKYDVGNRILDRVVKLLDVQ
jgi:phosphopantothenoylcysteine decarboxylase/phosphopantothenate--cysteine ligase